ncbi:MAG: phosphoethanolamine transferase [Bacteroidaceae bacterium]|nr:phosphoethanolamine transferase [Bacteroidaceae bacterium]
MKQKLVFFFYLAILILPNLILCATETMPVAGKLALVLLPLGIYWTVMSLFPRQSVAVWWMFPVLFLGAFNIVLSYLFGKGVIAVDMWLNLTTSSPDEMGEMLSQIYPAVVAVVAIYVPTLFFAAMEVCRKTVLDRGFRRVQRRIGLVVTAVSLPFVAVASCGGSWSVLDDMFPVNVCYNLRLAVSRQSLSRRYIQDTRDFRFHALDADCDTIAKVLVLVLGETSRATNWQLNGYDRETTPLLARTPGIAVFVDCMSQSNTTHKSIPILLSPATAEDYGALYRSKGLLAAFDEAGYHTVFLSNEPRNKSFNDYLGEQAREVLFMRDRMNCTPMDSVLLPEIERILHADKGNLLLVVHTYGSHSTYSDRYKPEQAYFRPDKVIKATRDNREILINAYDNTIRYTDFILHSIVTQLQKESRPAALLYTSDHGEDIYDDDRNLYLHASPWPSYYQLHVPFIIWTSDSYRARYPQRVALMESRILEPIQTDCVFPTMLGLGGIVTPYTMDSLALTSPYYVTKVQRTYLNDHNEPLTFDRCLEQQDFRAMRQRGLRTY